jgi:hypothetical protein
LTLLILFSFLFHNSISKRVIMFGFWDVVLVRKLPKFSANYKQFSFEEMIFSSLQLLNWKITIMFQSPVIIPINKKPNLCPFKDYTKRFKRNIKNVSWIVINCWKEIQPQNVSPRNVHTVLNSNVFAKLINFRWIWMERIFIDFDKIEVFF